MRQIKAQFYLAIKGITPLFITVIKVGLTAATLCLLTAIFVLILPKNTVYDFVFFTLLFKEALHSSILCLFLSVTSGLMIDAYIRKLDR